jgi:hypothetical protein
MLVAMTLGVEKEKSGLIVDQDASDFWDELFSEVAEIKAKGGEVSIPEL